ncbi:MAG: helix-turn-helix transcriptional regulator [Owenweeksia sp.]
MDSEEVIRKIGKKIVAIRKEKGISQIELATKLNIEDSALRRIEKGRTNPTIKTLYDISICLGVELAELVNIK